MNPNSEQWSARADAPGKLNVLSMFLTVDGEATAFHVGTWTVFVRLTGCRVGCRWCDTKYSWSIKQGELMTPEEMRNVTLKLAQGALKVSITGGEPLEQDNELLAQYIQMMIDFGFSVSVETSGTESLRGIIGRLPTSHRHRVSFVVDYKLPSAHAVKEFDWYGAFANMTRTDVVKFVVADGYDYREMLRVMGKMWRRWQAYGRSYMPRIVASAAMTDTPGSESKMSPRKLADSLKSEPEKHARMIGINLQQHKYIWDDDARDEEWTTGPSWTEVLSLVRHHREATT